MIKNICCPILFIFILLASSRVEPGRPVQRPLVVGIASWYGPGFDGRQTASGSIFNMHELSAAHRTLPLGTRILVKNLKNARSIVVRVTDRGPYVHGRILDLSLGAARRLDMVQDGIEKVQIEVISKNGH